MLGKSSRLNTPINPLTGNYIVRPNIPFLPTYTIWTDYWYNNKFKTGTTEQRKQILLDIEKNTRHYIGNIDYLDDPDFNNIEKDNYIKQKLFIEKWNKTHPDLKRENEERQRKINVEKLAIKEKKEREERGKILHAQILEEEKTRETRETRETPSSRREGNLNSRVLYEILGVNETASSRDIRKAYIDLSRIHHPDKGGNENDFKKIGEAYDILFNPEKREQYDNGTPITNIRGGKKSIKRKSIKRKSIKKKSIKKF